MKTNCKIDIEDATYDAVRLYAKIVGVTFDEAVNRLLEYAFTVQRVTSALETKSCHYKLGEK